jgi:hypothetical protein
MNSAKSGNLGHELCPGFRFAQPRLRRWCSIATLCAELAGAGRHFPDSISKRLIGLAIFFRPSCRVRSLAGRYGDGATATVAMRW